LPPRYLCGIATKRRNKLKNLPFPFAPFVFLRSQSLTPNSQLLPPKNTKSTKEPALPLFICAPSRPDLDPQPSTLNHQPSTNMNHRQPSPPDQRFMNEDLNGQILSELTRIRRNN
jgi:hypothetical protein